MTKHTFLTLMLLGFLLPVQAQIETITQVIEPALLECRYKWVQKTDTLGTGIAVDTMVLRIGKNVSQSYPQSTFFGDSLVNTPNGGELFSKLFDAALGDTTGAIPMPMSRIINEYHYKNYPKGKLTTWAPRATVYQIEEDYEKQAWALVDDSIKTVFGYKCQLATCTFRGRTYKAWYTTQLPYPEGPWKFNGLPGLITEVYDTKDHYHFTLVSLKQNNVTPVCFYNVRSELQPEVERIDRITFLKQRGEFLLDYNKQYDYMETDYHEH